MGPPPPGETRDPGLWAYIPPGGPRPVECWPPAYLPALDLSNDGSYASGFRFAGAGLASPEATARAMERATRLHDAGKITDEALELTLATILNPPAGHGGVRDDLAARAAAAALGEGKTRRTGRGELGALTDAELEAAGTCGATDEFCAIFWPGGTITRAGRTDAQLLAMGYIPKGTVVDGFECYPPSGTPWWKRLLAWIVRTLQAVIEPITAAAELVIRYALDFATAAPPVSSPIPAPVTADPAAPAPKYVYRMNAWPGGFVCDTIPPQRADLVPPVWSVGGPCPT